MPTVSEDQRNGERKSSDGRVEAGHHPRRCFTFAWMLLLVTMAMTSTGSNEHWKISETDSVRGWKKWRWGRRQTTEGDELIIDSKTGESWGTPTVKTEKNGWPVKVELLKTNGRRACCGDAGEKSRRRR